MSRIFINYRRSDSEGYVGRLYDHLSQHLDRDLIFMDIDDIPPGADFVQTLNEAVAKCDVFLAVIGRYWLDASDEVGNRRLDAWNDFVRIEIEVALKQQKMVIPVLVQGAQMPHPDLLPDTLKPLARRNAIELNHRSFARDVEHLANIIRQRLQLDAKPDKPDSKVQTPAREYGVVKPPNLPRQTGPKADAMRAIRDAIMDFKTSPLYDYRNEMGYYPVMGEGNLDAKIMLVGEAPGHNEAQQGRPFVGPSGDVLNELLGAIGLSREEIYLTNILKDRAPGNRDPNKDELAAYGSFLEQEIAVIRPQVIATLGRFSMTYLLRLYDRPEKKDTISALHGKLIRTQADYGEIFIVPLYHPAVVLYSPSKREELHQDFDKLRVFV